ncbi:MAG: hypothetical protein JWP69_1157 [Flaviaesturariibacter sp.]|nr:hypothetical protein [Flaviaesturariibacter sp.]
MIRPETKTLCVGHAAVKILAPLFEQGKNINGDCRNRNKIGKESMLGNVLVVEAG